MPTILYITYILFVLGHSLYLIQILIPIHFIIIVLLHTFFLFIFIKIIIYYLRLR